MRRCELTAEGETLGIRCPPHSSEAPKVRTFGAWGVDFGSANPYVRAPTAREWAELPILLAHIGKVNDPAQVWRTSLPYAVIGLYSISSLASARVG